MVKFQNYFEYERQISSLKGFKQEICFCIFGQDPSASLVVVQGGQSVEVRAIGVSKGDVHDQGIDYVVCIVYFLTKVEPATLVPLAIL
ncbi:hypothetical protein PIB30_004676 [Stylosanthes scabra]|uniref:Uncharacterized protein n=1 Tax=Stylosanthes scabra TaxID=79078 RepID=A0ABU6Q4S2_9FABA|nr:hypothetical protein [Stylosanthes scabra]